MTMMGDERAVNRPQFNPLQFGTRTLLAGVAALAVLLVVLQQVGTIWAVVIVWFLILVAAHVAGNVRGSLHASEPPAEHPGSAASEDAPARPGIDSPIRFAPATRLRMSRSFGRVLVAVTAVCAAFGLVFGTVALALATRAGLGGIVLGALSAAVLGGFLGFTSGSFVMVATRAFREATGEPQGSFGRRPGKSH
jgi:hypothetical protein